MASPRRFARFAWLVLVPLQLALLGAITRPSARTAADGAKVEGKVETPAVVSGPRFQSRDVAPRSDAGPALLLAASFELGVVRPGGEAQPSVQSRVATGDVEGLPHSRAPPLVS